MLATTANIVKTAFAVLSLGLATLYGVLPLLLTFYVIDRKPLRNKPKPHPFDFGFNTVKDVMLCTQDGMLISAWWLPGEPGQVTIIIAHGRGSCKADLLDQAAFFGQLGCHVLMVDLRAHGDSQGHWVSWGRLEAYDLLAAVDLVRQNQQRGHPTVLYGFSLGAQAALQAAAHHPDIAGVIAIAPGLSLRSWFHRQFRRYTGLPALPGLYNMFSFYAHLRSGIVYDHGSLDLTSRVAEIGSVPLLIICGEHDWMATPDDARHLQSVATQAKVVVIPGADHLGTLYCDRQAYRRAISEFLAQLIPSR